MSHRIEVCLKQALVDPAGKRLKSRIALDLGIVIDDLHVGDAYIIDRDLNRDQLELIVEEVFRDPVIQEASIDKPLSISFDHLIEVGFRPGVTDNVGRTSREAVERTLHINFGPDEGIYTRKLYFITGDISEEQVARIAKDLLANDLIQTWTLFSIGDELGQSAAPRVTSRSEAIIRAIDLNTSDDLLMKISRDGVLALNLKEMQAIRAYYLDPAFLELRKQAALGPAITDCELEVPCSDLV